MVAVHLKALQADGVCLQGPCVEQGIGVEGQRDARDLVGSLGDRHLKVAAALREADGVGVVGVVPLGVVPHHAVPLRVCREGPAPPIAAYHSGREQVLPRRARQVGWDRDAHRGPARACREHAVRIAAVCDPDRVGAQRHLGDGGQVGGALRHPVGSCGSQVRIPQHGGLQHGRIARGKRPVPGIFGRCCERIPEVDAGRAVRDPDPVAARLGIAVEVLGFRDVELAVHAPGLLQHQPVPQPPVLRRLVDGARHPVAVLEPLVQGP